MALRVGQLLVIFCLVISLCQGTTHWVVTEDGMITQQLDSVFNMREPYNVIALLGQEKRSEEVNVLEGDLRSQKANIEANEDKDTDLEQRFLETDSDCVAAGRPLSEFELYISTALSLEQKGVNSLDHLKTKIGEVKKYRQPNCTRAFELTFSIHAFDHVKSVQDRHNISSFPEPELMYLLPSVGSLENAGHMIFKAMLKNKTSWVLFNLAAYYWRVKGRPEQVIECSRRALHFSPQTHKNVALMNMANVLHRGHLSGDAAILAEAALDGDQEIDIVYFTLGNIYAAIGEYNKSSWCFGHTARINPALGAAEKRQHAVKCHQKLERALEAQHSSLQRTLAELKDYQTKQEHLMELQKKLWSYQRKAEEQYEANLSYQKHRFLQEMGENPHCEVSQLGSGTQFLMCRRDGVPESDVFGLPYDEDSEIEVLDESRFQNNCVIFPNGDKNCLNLSFEDPSDHHSYSVPRVTIPVTPLADKMEYPTDQECKDWNRFNVEWKEYAHRVVPLYNNASLESLKTSIHFSGEIPPFEVPPCGGSGPLIDGSTGVDFVEGIAKRASLPKMGPPIPLMQLLRAFLDKYSMLAKEFDYRVTQGGSPTQELHDQFLVYTGASVYWRIHSNSLNAIECLRRAVFAAPADRVDVPLTNLALMMMDHGLIDDSLQILRMALVVDSLKPSTRYLLGCIHAMIGGYRQARQELALAHSLDPEFPNALEVLQKMRCVLKRTGGQDEPQTVKRLDGSSSQGTTSESVKRGQQQTQQTAGSSVPLRAAADIQEAIPACVQGPPLGLDPGQEGCTGGACDPQRRYSSGVQAGNPGAQENPGNNQNTFKTCNGGSVPSTPFGPQIPAAPAPDVDVHQLLSKTHLTWPTLEECGGYRKLNLKAFYSTWISISAKDMKLEDYIDFVTPISIDEMEIQPYCDPDEPISMHTLDHLHAMQERRDLTYEAEQGLREVLQTINGGYMHVDEVGARIARLLSKDPESWIATNMAGLYWRIEGKSENALDCLRHALHYAPPNMKDLAMVSIANIFHRVGLHEDAATIAGMAIEISPQLVINHFTLANIYSSMGQWDHALDYYESTLRLQPDFQPAVERLRTIQCNVLQLTGTRSVP